MIERRDKKITESFIVIVVGVALIGLSFLIFIGQYKEMKSNILALIYMFFLCPPLIGFGIYMLFYPLSSRYQKVEVTMNFITFPLFFPFKMGLRILPYHTMVMAFIMSVGLLVLIPIYSWKLFSWMGLASQGHEKPFTYIALNVAFIVINYLGQSVARLFLWSLNSHRFHDYSRFLDALKPKWIRLYIYVVATGAYMLSNIEKFIEHEVFHAKWWGIYKSILIETLLTYIIIDTAIHIWRDNNKKTKFVSGEEKELQDSKT